MEQQVQVPLVEIDTARVGDFIHNDRRTTQCKGKGKKGEVICDCEWETPVHGVVCVRNEISDTLTGFFCRSVYSNGWESCYEFAHGSVDYTRYATGVPIVNHDNHGDKGMGKGFQPFKGAGHRLQGGKGKAKNGKGKTVNNAQGKGRGKGSGDELVVNEGLGSSGSATYSS